MPRPMQSSLEAILAATPYEPFVRTLARSAAERPDAPLLTYDGQTLTRGVRIVAAPTPARSNDA